MILSQNQIPHHMTLTALLLYDDRSKTVDQQQLQQIDQEDKLLKQLKDLRNKIIHHPLKFIDDVEFDQFWSDLTSILVALGDIASELHKLKDDSVFEDRSQSLNEQNVKEARHLNSLGTRAHKDGKYADAITLFIKATDLSGIADHDRAVFYSNMSYSRLALYEKQSGASNTFEVDDPRDERYYALQDAKKARNLWMIWWKGHHRVGKAYASINEHEKAINSFGRALALDPTNNEIQKALDDSRQIYGIQSREEHLDPRLKPITMAECLNELQEKYGMDPQKIRLGHSLAETLDPVGADVVKGHKYAHGDIDFKQDYEQAAKYFAKAASRGNAEGMYNLARLTDLGLGVKKDHNMALKLLEQAAAQSSQHPRRPCFPNLGVAEAEHALGLKYADGIGVHKNLQTAAYWYRRAADHGSAQGANNLAVMYEKGLGVEKDLNTAQQLYELAATRGDPNAMLSLAELLRDKNDLQILEMAKTWYDRACESGNIVARAHRDIFEQTLCAKRWFIDQCSRDTLKMMDQMKNLFASLKIGNTANKQLDQPPIYDYKVLTEHAHRGSLTAKRMCKALEHFFEAFYILIENENLTEQQEKSFIHELSYCYRMEHIVAQFPGMKMRERVSKIIDRVLYRCNVQLNDVTAELDENTRICYAVLHIDSHELIAQFLETCKQKYPKSSYFFELSAAVNGFMKQYERSLYDSNSGLEIDPNYVELLYFKAVALRLIGKDMDEAIRAYQAFLAVAPKDHRKVPESYYAIAACHLERHMPTDILEDFKKIYTQEGILEDIKKIYMQGGILDIVRKRYTEGEEAEKIQLPCFLPYDSNNKTLVKFVIDLKSLLNTESTPVMNRKSHLTNPYRIEMITKHREWESKALQLMNDPEWRIRTSTWKPQFKQSTAKSLIDLKLISLEELNSMKDQVCEGYILSVTIIEEAYSWSPSIHLVVEDENLDCERLLICDFPDEQGEYLTSKVFTNGSKIRIINPYLRVDADDMKPLIRIVDFSSIIMQSESERVMNMCRCCGEANASHVCSICKARYCSKECQTMDWKTYKHKLICRKQ